MNSGFFDDIVQLFTNNPDAKKEADECKLLVADMLAFHHATAKEQDDAKNSKRFIPISVEHFSNDCEQNLYYIGVSHIHENAPNYNPKNPTYETIKAAFGKYDGIKAVVIEMSEFDIAHLVKGGGEPAFIINLAKERGITIIAGEPSKSEILAGLKKAGYSAKDYMGLMALHNMPNMGNSVASEVDKNALIALTNSYLEQNFPVNKIPENERLKDYADFQKWYQEHGGTADPFKDTGHSIVSPAVDGTYFQKLGEVFGKVRADHIVPTIAKAINEHRNVLVGYGKGHKDTDLPVIQEMFNSKGVTEVLVSQEPPTKNEQQGHGLANGVSGGGRCR